jgi:FkbM family methyltransferase
MDKSYFILLKPNKLPINRNERNQSLEMNDNLVYILPQTHLSYHRDSGLFEADLIEWSKQLCSKDKCFLDIGAHTGTYALSLADYCQHVHAFEPQKNTYYALCGGVVLSSKNNVTCYQMGLGSPEQVGSMKLKIVHPSGGGSSLHATSGIIGEEEIQVQMLDSINLENIGFIKMDVEENEYHVLKGAVKTLERSGYPTILFEANNDNQQLFDLIKSLGSYKILKISNYHNMFLACH